MQQYSLCPNEMLQYFVGIKLLSHDKHCNMFNFRKVTMLKALEILANLLINFFCSYQGFHCIL